MAPRRRPAAAPLVVAPKAKARGRVKAKAKPRIRRARTTPRPEDAAGWRSIQEWAPVIGQHEVNGITPCKNTGMAEVLSRRVLHQPSPPPDRSRSSTARLVLCSRVSRGRPVVRVEVQPSRSSDGIGRSSRTSSCGPRPRLRSKSGRGSSTASSCPARTKGSITLKGKEVEGKGSNQADGEVQHVGLERVQLRPRVSSSTYKPQKKERGERQFGQQREDNEPGPIGSGGFVPRRSSVQAYREEMPRPPGSSCHQGSKRLLTEMGEDPSSQTPLPVFVRYFRQVFDHSGASTPMKREYLTLAHCLDSLLEGNALRCLDIVVQRLRAVEQISQGVFSGTANRMELHSRKSGQ